MEFDERLREILTDLAPTAEESSHITGSEPFYAIKESDLPKLVAQLKQAIKDGMVKPGTVLMYEGKEVRGFGDGYRRALDDIADNLNLEEK